MNEWVNNFRTNYEIDAVFFRCARANEGLRCFAADAAAVPPVLRGRIGGSFTRVGGEEEDEKDSDGVVFDDSRVVFGQSS